jgi:hypothetical protein
MGPTDEIDAGEAVEMAEADAADDAQRAEDLNRETRWDAFGGGEALKRELMDDDDYQRICRKDDELDSRPGAYDDEGYWRVLPE